MKMLLEANFYYRRIRWSGSPLYLILADSNAKGTTADSVKNYIPKEECDNLDVRIVIPYTLEEAYRRVGSGDIDVNGANVIIDVLTNDIRGTWRRPAATPEELVWRVDRLRGRLRDAGAVATVVCQPKPMEVVDVSPYSSAIHDYLQAQGGMGFGCGTQVRRNFLERDGYHIQPRFASVISITYACAVLGWHVPDPTPWEDFKPEWERRRFDADYPSLVRNAWGQGVGFEGPRNYYGR